jgi:hypothetical protein
LKEDIFYKNMHDLKEDLDKTYVPFPHFYSYSFIQITPEEYTKYRKEGGLKYHTSDNVIDDYRNFLVNFVCE